MADSFYSFAREEGTSIHYAFTTHFEIVYSVYFNPADFSVYLDEMPHLREFGCLFGFSPVNEPPGKKIFDPMIAPTVCRIIQDYFETFGKDRVLLFHCDNDDGRQRCRDKLFEKWYSNQSKEFFIHKDGLEVEIENADGSKRIEYLGFIVYGSESSALQIIKSEFIEISVMLIDSKSVGGSH